MPYTGGFPQTILLADDDEDDRSFFKDALHEVADSIQLLEVANGIEAMNLLQAQNNQPPDLVFLDLNMPRKNGYECLEEIKKTPGLQFLPVVIMSTSLQPDGVDHVYRNGANLYVVKPNDYRKLKKMIEQVLAFFTRETHIQPSKETFILQA